jgi:kinesin family member C2/C3
MNGPKDNPGVNRRAIKKLLALISDSSDTIQVQLFASIMEVYNENIFDLLAPEGRVKRDIKVGPQGAFVHELCERSITTAEECDQLTEDSDKNRSIASTSMNSESSRSHLLFQIRVDTTNRVSGMRSSAKLTLVDLAGSERIAKSEVYALLPLPFHALDTMQCTEKDCILQGAPCAPCAGTDPSST